ncbi:uncharacterized protein LOC101846798 [Aplysia californica]|uniref:Uncharacterized protein LOC101846798 n=1 Tax=Aplysia californica TaxID=6500 RepID=A0ABM0JH34_APLCA|nr:uncharacterized protein LOC101846798 [Aplysia californica]
MESVPSFRVFVQSVKPRMKSQYPFLSQEQIMLKLRHQWKFLDSSTRQNYGKLRSKNRSGFKPSVVSIKNKGSGKGSLQLDEEMKDLHSNFSDVTDTNWKPYQAHKTPSSGFYGSKRNDKKEMTDSQWVNITSCPKPVGNKSGPKPIYGRTESSDVDSLKKMQFGTEDAVADLHGFDEDDNEEDAVLMYRPAEEEDTDEGDMSSMSCMEATEHEKKGLNKDSEINDKTFQKYDAYEYKTETPKGKRSSKKWNKLMSEAKDVSNKKTEAMYSKVAFGIEDAKEPFYVVAGDHLTETKIKESTNPKESNTKGNERPNKKIRKNREFKEQESLSSAVNDNEITQSCYGEDEEGGEMLSSKIQYEDEGDMLSYRANNEEDEGDMFSSKVHNDEDEEDMLPSQVKNDEDEGDILSSRVNNDENEVEGDLLSYQMNNGEDEGGIILSSQVNNDEDKGGIILSSQVNKSGPSATRLLPPLDGRESESPTAITLIKAKKKLESLTSPSDEPVEKEASGCSSTVKTLSNRCDENKFDWFDSLTDDSHLQGKTTTDMNSTAEHSPEPEYLGQLFQDQPRATRAVTPGRRLSSCARGSNPSSFDSLFQEAKDIFS